MKAPPPKPAPTMPLTRPRRWGTHCKTYSMSRKKCAWFWCFCFLWLCYQFFIDWCDLFGHILRCCFNGTGTIVRLPRYNFSGVIQVTVKDMDKIATKHKNSRTMGISRAYIPEDILQTPVLLAFTESKKTILSTSGALSAPGKNKLIEHITPSKI